MKYLVLSQIRALDDQIVYEYGDVVEGKEVDDQVLQLLGYVTKILCEIPFNLKNLSLCGITYNQAGQVIKIEAPRYISEPQNPPPNPYTPVASVSFG